MPRNREKGFFLAVFTALVVSTVSLIGTWRARQDPLPGATDSELQLIYESNLKNFAQSCEGHAADPSFGRMKDFCRQQATLLSLLSLCDASCQRRTAPFMYGEATR